MLNEENLRKQEESVQKQEAMRRGKVQVLQTLQSSSQVSLPLLHPPPSLQHPF